MGRTRTKWFEKHGISKERYLELRSICMQYDQYRRKDWELRMGDAPKRSGNRVYSGTPDPTGHEAARRADSLPARKMRAIERAAEESCGAFAWAILENVTHGKPMETIDAPHGLRQMYQLRREFFAALDRIWDEMIERPMAKKG